MLNVQGKKIINIINRVVIFLSLFISLLIYCKGIVTDKKVEGGRSSILLVHSLMSACNNKGWVRVQPGASNSTPCVCPPWPAALPRALAGRWVGRGAPGS